MLAKQRMRMGYWEAMIRERTKKLAECGEDVDTVRFVKEMQRAKVSRDGNLAMGSTQAMRDELLYQKVCVLLDSDEVITNPLGKLVENEIYDILDEGNRQKYILDLSKRFCEMKQRYYTERSMVHIQ